MTRATSSKISVGNHALSAFRLEKLRATLKAVMPDVTLEETRHWYFTELKAPLNDAEERLLERLLNLDASMSQPAASLQKLLVIPRLGTISPWSSKATDIAQHCALPSVARIERGMVYFL